MTKAQLHFGMGYVNTVDKLFGNPVISFVGFACVSSANSKQLTPVSYTNVFHQHFTPVSADTSILRQRFTPASYSVSRQRLAPLSYSVSDQRSAPASYTSVTSSEER